MSTYAIGTFDLYANARSDCKSVFLYIETVERSFFARAPFRHGKHLRICINFYHKDYQYLLSNSYIHFISQPIRVVIVNVSDTECVFRDVVLIHCAT